MRPKFFSFVFLGNILEHHDKALFSLLVPFIGAQFFQHTDSISVLISTYSALFLSILARPIGAIFFGILADQSGRLKTLSATILGMSFATFSIGCLPAYSKIGILAPILLTFFRGLQNFFAAGETNAASVFMIERSQNSLKTLMGSLFEASTVVGILLASFELALLSHFDLMDRWPMLFWIAGIFGLIGFYIRRNAKVEEPLMASKRFSIKDLSHFWRPMVAITIGAGFSCATYVMSITFLNSYLTLTSTLSLDELNKLNLALLTFDACLLPLFGWLACKWNMEKIMIAAVSTLCVLGIPLFQSLEGASLLVIVSVRTIIVCIGACFAACFRAWAQSLVPMNVRCTILSISCSTANLLVEGPIVLLSLYAFQHTKWIACPGILLSGISLLTVLALVLAKPKQQVAIP